MMNSNQSTRQSSGGYSLVELFVTIAIFIALVIAITPAIGQMRTQARDAASTANLLAIGQARDMYAKENKDRIFSYSWRAGETYLMPDGRERNLSTDVAAMQYQNTEILMRRTGRAKGREKFNNISSTIPHRRFTHLVLMDYMAGEDDAAFPGIEFVDPDDQQLLAWQAHPLDYLEQYGGMPYGSGQVFNGYESSSSFSLFEHRQRWSYGSSYFITPFAWQGDGPNNVYRPISGSPHLFGSTGSPDLTGRFMNQVQFPSSKVHMFEEFDREQARHPYFAYDHAAPEKLMFDGSINSQSSGEAASSVDPSAPNQGVWRQRYVPLDTFPVPVEGLGKSDDLDMRYMWTKFGLQGVDYTP